MFISCAHILKLFSIAPSDSRYLVILHKCPLCKGFTVFSTDKIGLDVI